MKSDFEKAVSFLFVNEGSAFTDIVEDRGGPTIYGITLAELTEWRGRKQTKTDVKNLSKIEAKNIYKKKYWDPLNLDNVDDPLATIIFDQAVNRGVWRVARELQGIVGVSKDGVIGPKTLSAINNFSARYLGFVFIKSAQLYYIDICKSDKSQLIFLSGWVRRTQRLLDLVITA